MLAGAPPSAGAWPLPARSLAAKDVVVCTGVPTPTYVTRPRRTATATAPTILLARTIARGCFRNKPQRLLAGGRPTRLNRPRVRVRPEGAGVGEYSLSLQRGHPPPRSAPPDQTCRHETELKTEHTMYQANLQAHRLNRLCVCDPRIRLSSPTRPSDVHDANRLDHTCQAPSHTLAAAFPCARHMPSETEAHRASRHRRTRAHARLCKQTHGSQYSRATKVTHHSTPSISVAPNMSAARPAVL